MPELPEVEALARFLAEEAVGKKVGRVEVHAISALKTFDPPVDALVGHVLAGTDRRGKFLLLDFEGIVLAIHLSRSGWVQWRDQITAKPGRGPKRGPMALRVKFSDGSGFDVTEQATEKRLQVHVVSKPEEVESIATQGPDPLSAALDGAAFAALLAGRKQQIKGVLTDQHVLAGVGNAYSDEALHLANLSPFKHASTLTPDEVRTLYRSLREVLTDAVERSLGLPAKGLKAEKKSGMRVHGRVGEKCPECGDIVREVSFATSSLQYCATCQTGGKPLADRRLSRLLK
ncbi:MAG: Fpg/Nei family DNA glycosylase [Mycobacteriales bacterium]